MLEIRPEQMQVFKLARLAAFEDEMLGHSQIFSPVLSRVIGEEQLRVALGAAIVRANAYGFTNRGTIRLFIELMFLFGSYFDTDPQYPWAAKILMTQGDQMMRAEELFDEIVNYQEKVSGPNSTYTVEALREVAALARTRPDISCTDFIPNMLREVTRVFPQKAGYIGKEQLTALIQKGSSEALKYLSPTIQGEILLVVLMFSFGHGCIDDPLYPWIRRTLTDERIVRPAARFERLQKKATTWLNHILSASIEQRNV